MKTTIDKHGQYIAKDLMPLTPMEEAQKTILTRDYKLAKGNISRTARMVGWPRTKVLRKLKEWKLYDLYPHEPGPYTKEK